MILKLEMQIKCFLIQQLFLSIIKKQYYKYKRDKTICFVSLVPHTRVELVIFCVRGRCPGPLDECGSSFADYEEEFPLKSLAKIRTLF